MWWRKNYARPIQGMIENNYLCVVMKTLFHIHTASWLQRNKFCRGGLLCQGKGDYKKK